MLMIIDRRVCRSEMMRTLLAIFGLIISWNHVLSSYGYSFPLTLACIQKSGMRGCCDCLTNSTCSASVCNIVTSEYELTVHWL